MDLVERLTQPDIHHRRQALQEVDPQQRLSEEEILAILDLTGAEDEDVRAEAARLLEDRKHPTVMLTLPLANRLNVETGDVAFWAATLLGRIGPDARSAVPALAHAAQHHPDLFVRQRCIMTLGTIGSAATAAIPALDAIARGDDPRLSRRAADALERIGK